MEPSGAGAPKWRSNSVKLVGDKGGVVIGRPRRHRPRLEYLPAVVAEYGAGPVLLSLCLPLQTRPARTEIARFGGRDALVVERYDRTSDHGRLHQDDFTQVLGIASAAKYDQWTATPSRLAQVVATATPHPRNPESFTLDLLRR